MTNEPVIISATRTAVGSFGGTLRDVEVVELGSVVLREALSGVGLRPEVPDWIKDSRPEVLRDVDVSELEEQHRTWSETSRPVIVDEVIMGNVLQGGQGMNTARQAAIRAGLPREVPSYTVNKVCGSGLKTIALAAEKVASGRAGAVLAGGMESMSGAPYAIPDARWGYRMNPTGFGETVDMMVYDALYEIFYDYHMGQTAENIAREYDISRREQDELGAESHHRARAAVEGSLFQDEIVPVEIPGEDQPFTIDERPMETSVDSMGQLPPAFREDGTVTAGNASGINDGAAAVLVMSRETAQELDLDILASVKSWTSAGVEPKMMGLGPVAAVNRLQYQSDLSLDDVDVIELNEAFASQTIAVLRELDLPRYGESGRYSRPGSSRVNPHGSGISLGHPVGATGTRMMVSLLHELERQGGRLGLATLCIGGGQGFAMLVDREE